MPLQEAGWSIFKVKSFALRLTHGTIGVPRFKVQQLFCF